MRLSPKNIVAGGLIFYFVAFVLSFITGSLIHEGTLAAVYDETASFWRPELQQDPPDMAAVMPRWITIGLLTAFVFAGIYDNIRDGLNGFGCLKGLKFGLLLGLIHACFAGGWSGVFNLPDIIWVWWIADVFFLYAIAGVALGWFIARWGTSPK